MFHIPLIINRITITEIHLQMANMVGKSTVIWHSEEALVR